MGRVLHRSVPRMLAAAATCVIPAFFAGCGKDYSCSGTPAPCYSHVEQETCTRAECAWGPTCAPTRCALVDTADTCGAISYCRWESTGCEFSSDPPCSSLEGGDCASVAGCSPAVACSGTHPACDRIDGKNQCVAIGCEWTGDNPYRLGARVRSTDAVLATR